MAGYGCTYGNGCRLCITCFSNQNNIRILSQQCPQSTLKGQSRHGIDLHLIHTFDILLHRILNGCDVHLTFCQRFQNHIQGCCFTATGRPSNINDTMRHLHHTAHFRIIIRIHAVLLFIQNRCITVQKTQNSLFTIYSWNHRYTKIHTDSLNRCQKVSVLRNAFLGDIHIAYNFNADDQRLM